MREMCLASTKNRVYLASMDKNIRSRMMFEWIDFKGDLARRVQKGANERQAGNHACSTSLAATAQCCLACLQVLQVTMFRLYIT